MGFNQQDADAINRACELGYDIKAVSTTDMQYQMTRIVVNSEILTGGGKIAKVLSDALGAAARVHNAASTVWLVIEDDVIPGFVVVAIERMQAFGIGLIVTHKGCCSHLPGDPLPHNLQKAILKALGAGKIWHPIANKAIFATPD